MPRVDFLERRLRSTMYKKKPPRKIRGKNVNVISRLLKLIVIWANSHAQWRVFNLNIQCGYSYHHFQGKNYSRTPYNALFFDLKELSVLKMLVLFPNKNEYCYLSLRNSNHLIETGQQGICRFKLGVKTEMILFDILEDLFSCWKLQ